MKAFAVLIISFSLPWLTLNAQVIQSDFQVLKAFYDATGGSNWTNNTGWDFSKGAEHVSSWNKDSKTGFYGLTIHNGRVIGITLSKNNLRGHIPNDICMLDRLAWLFLSNNQLSGKLPENIGELTRMYSINLHNNNIEGTLPASFVNIGKEASISKDPDDGFDVKSRVQIWLSGNKLKNISTNFASMPLLNLPRTGFEVILDRNCFKDNIIPSYFQKRGASNIYYGRNYVQERVSGVPLFKLETLANPPTFKGASISTFKEFYLKRLISLATKQDRFTPHKVTISFVVDKNGVISIRKVVGELPNEHKKILTESAPYWKPAKIDGIPVSTTYTCTTNFTRIWED